MDFMHVCLCGSGSGFYYRLKGRLGKGFHDQERTSFQPHYMGLEDFDSPRIIMQPVRVPATMFKGYDFAV